MRKPTDIACFPLYWRPGRVAFLDDDPDYLEMLAEVMPEDWAVSLFEQPAAFIRSLQQEPPLESTDEWQHRRMLERWRDGAALIPQFVEYWRQDGQARYARHNVCVVDYSMPAMNGIEALDELVQWSGHRVLLTGRADEQIAVRAFNRGIIDQYIPKQSPDITERLISCVRELRALTSERLQQTWRNTLSWTQLQLMRDTSVAGALRAALDQRGCVEHFVIGDPFGVLALDAEGRSWWLQLETPRRLEELAQLAQEIGFDAQTQNDIRAGRCVLDAELTLGLGRSRRQAERHPAQRLDCGPELYGACIALSEAWCPGAASAYRSYLDRARLLRG